MLSPKRWIHTEATQSHRQANFFNLSRKFGKSWRYPEFQISKVYLKSKTIDHFQVWEFLYYGKSISLISFFDSLDFKWSDQVIRPNIAVHTVSIRCYRSIPCLLTRKEHDSTVILQWNKSILYSLWYEILTVNNSITDCVKYCDSILTCKFQRNCRLFFI